MSQLNVDTIGSQTGTTISVASGHTLSGTISGTITEFDQWRWTSTVNATETLADSWARPTGTLQGGYIGTGMTVDSSTGAWTFPSTGIWKVEGTFYLHIQTTSATYLTMKSIATNDNFSSEDEIDFAVHFGNGNVDRATVSNIMLLDIQNTSNDKIKFKFEESTGTGQMEGSTNENRTYITFTRMGDT